MASTYSSNLKIELMATGENSGTWGTVTNTNLGTTLEQAIVGYGTVDYIADANLTISITNNNASQAARALVLNVTSGFGSLSQTRELVVPTIQKQYIVQNNTTGGQSITVKTAAGTGITVPNGRKAHLYVDGTNVIQMFDFVDINGGTIDGATVGANSASSGAFTTLAASGATTLNGAVTLGDAAGDNITFNGTVTSHLLFTDNTYDIGASGATRPRNLFLAGAATIGGNLSVGGTLTLTGGVNLNGNVTVGDNSSDTLTINSTITSNLIFTDNTYDIGASGATRPRNLFLAGSGTIGGNVTTAGRVIVDDTTDSTSATTGSIQTDGGVGIAKSLYVGGGQVISVNTSSNALRITQTGTGNALLVEDSANPDSTPFVIDASGRVLVGGTSAVASLTLTPALQIQGTSLSTATSLTSAWGAISAQAHFARSAGTTVGDYTALVSGNNIGSIRFAGADGTQFVAAADITAAVDGTPGTNDMPGRLVFSTTADGASTPTERLRIDSAGLTTITGTAVVSSNSSSDALRITQTGSGNALVVEDSANPDASPFVVDANGTVVKGYSSAITTGSFTAPFQLHGTSSTAINNGYAAYSWHSTGAGAGYSFYKSRGGVIGTPSVVSDGDNIGRTYYIAYDGASWLSAAQIDAFVDGTPGTNDMPGRLVFSTTADGASTPTERLRISANGLSTFGSQAATGAALSTTAPAKIYTGTGTYTDSSTAASGTVTHGTINAFDNPAIAASNTTVTYTNASTLYIDGAPTAGTNVTITNPYSLFVNSGTVWLGGNVTGTDPVVQQSDIGSGPNEIPLNQYLGALAYEDTETPALDVGTGITGGTGTICKANGGLMGGIYQMTVLIDLTGLNSGGTAGDIIGVNGTANPCYIAQLPAMTVLGGRMTCLETPAGGDDDIDLYSAAEGTGVEDQAISALTETEIINAGAQTRGTVTYFSADPAANAYFYLVGQGTANATYTAGRFLIEVFGVL